ncbi:hypothetical protein [Bradyrhizobium sp. OAE829]|uniref:hypothetical protein n=1 Tax=Bradyrhizobium sp. OAE829 TaxID=2663807 RepID=UPI0019FF6AD8
MTVLKATGHCPNLSAPAEVVTMNVSTRRQSGSVPEELGLGSEPEQPPAAGRVAAFMSTVGRFYLADGTRGLGVQAARSSLPAGPVAKLGEEQKPRLSRHAAAEAAFS